MRVGIVGAGIGGLAAAIALEKTAGVTVFSAGTDGIDGPTDAAGAVADSSTLLRACVLKLDPRSFLDDNDSCRFFERAGGLVKTGPTGTNVMDVRILLI